MKKQPEELDALAALIALNLADDEDKLQFADMTDHPSSSPSLLAQVDDFLAEAMAQSTPYLRPRVILKERISVATDPRLARVVTNEECAILSISPAFTELCGYQLEEIQGKKPGNFLQGVGTDPKAVRDFREAIREKSPCTVELLNYHKSGSPYWVKIDMRPIFHPDGTLEGFTAIEEKIS